MSDNPEKGISLSRYLTRPKWERDLNNKNLLHNQTVMDSRVLEELKRQTLPQALHDAFLDEMWKVSEKQASSQIKRAGAPRADATLNSIIETLATHPGKAKELWPELFGMMDAEGMEPEENEKEVSYYYNDAKGNRR